MAKEQRTGLWRTGCFKCGSETHKGITCPYAERAFQYAKKLRIQQEGAQANEDSVRYHPIQVRLSRSSLPPARFHGSSLSSTQPSQRSSPPPSPAHRHGSYTLPAQRSSPSLSSRGHAKISHRDDVAKSTNWRASSKSTSSIKSVRFDDNVSIIDDDSGGNVEFAGLFNEKRWSGFDEFAGLSWERHRKMTPPLAPKGNSASSSGSDSGPGSRVLNSSSGSDSGPGSRVLNSSSSSGRSRTPLVLAPKQSHLAPLTVVPLSDEIVPFVPGQSRFICDAVSDTDSDSDVEGFHGLTGVSWERPSKITTLATSGSGSGSNSSSDSGSSSGSGSSYTHTLLAHSQYDTIAPFTSPVLMINQARTTDQRKLANLKQDDLQDRERASILSTSIFKHFLSLTSLVLKAREE